MYAVLLAAAAAACCCLLLLTPKLVKGVRFMYDCRQAKSFYLESPIPGPPAATSILGHVSVLLDPRGPWTLSAWANGYGPLYKVQLLNCFGVVLTDPDSMTRLTRKTGPGPCLPKPRFIYSLVESNLGPSIITAPDGEYWKAVRQATAPCFSMTNLKQVVPMVLELTQRAADHMSQHDTFGITDAAKRITSDIMRHLLYGEDLRGTYWEPSEYLEMFYPMIMAQAGQMRNPLYKWHLWKSEVRYQRYCGKRHYVIAMDKVKRLRDHPPEPHTIAAHILSAIDPATGKPLDDARVMSEISTFMGAGFETTSHAITWALALLAAHPDIQEELFQELQAAGLAADGTASGRGFEASDLNRLPLLSAVMKETLRLSSPAPTGGIREVVNEEGVDICGYHVPKGSVVFFPALPFGLARHNYGSDAASFKPQRWMTSAASTDDNQLSVSGQDSYTDLPTISSSSSSSSSSGPDDAQGSALEGFHDAGGGGKNVSAAPQASAADISLQRDTAAADSNAPPDASGIGSKAVTLEPAGSPLPATAAEELADSTAGGTVSTTGTNWKPGGTVSTTGAKPGPAAAAAAAAAPPDHIAFMMGPRDCIGQNLAKLELQVVLATLLSRFRFSPGPELEQELAVAAATGQPVLTAVHALAAAFLSLQPASGQLMLHISSRG